MVALSCQIWHHRANGGTVRKARKYNKNRETPVIKGFPENVEATGFEPNDKPYFITVFGVLVAFWLHGHKKKEGPKPLNLKNVA